jgi:hypothetical protein
MPIYEFRVKLQILELSSNPKISKLRVLVRIFRRHQNSCGYSRSSKWRVSRKLIAIEIAKEIDYNTH